MARGACRGAQILGVHVPASLTVGLHADGDAAPPGPARLARALRPVAARRIVQGMGDGTPQALARRRRWDGASALPRLTAALAAERERWALWAPVALALGIALYFALPVEPAAWAGGLALALSGGGLWWQRRRGLAVVPLVAVVLAALGFAAAQGQARLAAAPVLAREVGPVGLVGRVAAVESMGESQRAVLADLRFKRRLDVAPARVRVRLTSKSPRVAVGDEIDIFAVLMPPPAPAMPGAFDFARRAWFEGLGGVGYAVSRAEILRRGVAAGPLGGMRQAIGAARQAVAARVRQGIPGPEGAIAAALLTAERGPIPEELLEAYRASGLAHLLSISGLHMSLVAGLVFFGVRGLLALAPPLALRFAIKKWTAAVALVAAFGYLLLAGAPVPTQRAFVMVALVLLAVMADRQPISLRLVAWAAVAVLLWQPYALMGPSLQMSFAAVVALVAAYEALAPRLARWRREHPGLPHRALVYVAGVALTTLIAGGATAAYAAHHFDRVATWSLAANLAAVPVFGLVVMPAAVAALVLMPLGLEGLALPVLGAGLEAVNAVARTVASWPGAVRPATGLTAPLLGLYTLGGLWLCLWRRRWRLLGLAPMLLAVGLAALHRPPDVLVDGQGRLMAVLAADGLLVNTLRAAAFEREVWLARTGGGKAMRWPDPGQASADGRLRCDSLGCVYTAKGRRVALARRAGALLEDCALADALISLVPLRRRCPRPAVVIDRFDLWRNGAHALWLDHGGVRVESVAEAQGERPWSLSARRRRE